MPEHADGEAELGTAAFALRGRRDEDELGEGVRVSHDDHAE
jgi:hypothetical protein